MRKILSIAPILLGAVWGCGGPSAAESTGDASIGTGTGGTDTGGAVSSTSSQSTGTSECPLGSHLGNDGACITTLSAWTAVPELNDARDHHVTFLGETKSGAYLYVLGGVRDQKTPVESVERAKIGKDGRLSAWTIVPNKLLTMGPGVATVGQKVLVSGGIRAGGVSTKTDIVTIKDDGSIDVAPGPDMLHARFHNATVVAGSWVYAVGAVQEKGLSQSTVERAPFDANGVGAWVEDRGLPEPRSHHAFVEHKGALYVIAGLNRLDASGTQDKVYSDILRATIGPDGALGEWKSVGTLPAPLAVHAAFVHEGELYVAFGLEGKSYKAKFVSSVHRARFAEDGSLGPFEKLPSELPIARGHMHQAPVFGTFVYSVGGASDVGTIMKSQAEAFFARFE